MAFDPAWESAHRSFEWGCMYDPRLIMMIWRRVQNLPTVTVLDIGCGIGAQAFEMARLGYNVVGFDGSPSAIARAKERAAEWITPFHIEFHVHDVTRPFGPESVADCVTEVCCLESMSEDDANAALDNVVSVLKPEGWLFSIHKADGWVNIDSHKVGIGSRALNSDEVVSFFGRRFRHVRFSRDEFTNNAGHRVPEWSIECGRPIK